MLIFHLDFYAPSFPSAILVDQQKSIHIGHYRVSHNSSWFVLQRVELCVKVVENLLGCSCHTCVISLRALCSFERKESGI